MENEKEKELLDIKNEKLQDISKREERRFIALLLKDKDHLKQAIAGGASFRFFNDPVQRQLFQLIARYYDSYGVLMTRNAFIELVERNFKEENQQAFYCTQFDQLYAIDVRPDDFGHLYGGIQDRYLQRQAFDVIARYYEPLINATSGQRKLVEKFQEEVFAIKMPFDDSYNRVITLQRVLDEEVMPEILERRENPTKFLGIPSGFQTLDTIYHGFRRGKYLVFSAMEGGGKTTVMLNFALNMVKAGYRVAYVTIEANAKEASYRALTIYSAVDINKIYTGGKGDDGINEYVMSELELAKKEMSDFSDKFMWVQCLQRTPWSHIELLLNQKLAFTDLDAIYVDYLDEIGTETSHPGRPDLELADVSSKVQNFGKKHDVLSVTAQQMKTPKVQELQKKQSKGDDFRFGTGDLSGTKKIAASCDYLFGLLLDQLSRDRIHVYNAKARHNRSQERATLSIDLNSGRMSELPSTFEFRKAVSSAASSEVKDAMLAEPVLPQQPPDSSAQLSALDNMGYVNSELPNATEGDSNPFNDGEVPT